MSRAEMCADITNLIEAAVRIAQRLEKETHHQEDKNLVLSSLVNLQSAKNRIGEYRLFGRPYEFYRQEHRLPSAHIDIPRG